MIYLGGAWPKEYHDQMFMGNIHGRRLNVDILNPKGSGYVASHSPDFLLANDAWARFINLRYGPDGNVYLIDWYDKQACHTNNPQIWDRTNGRIYKISYRGTKPVSVDLSKKTSAELARMQTNENDWYVRHARRLLMERGADKESRDVLENIAFRDKSLSEPKRLRGLWALHVTGSLTKDLLLKGMSDPAPYVRAWCVQLALENKLASPALLQQLEVMAQTDASPVVRLYLASGAATLAAGSALENLGRAACSRRRCRRSQFTAHVLVCRRTARRRGRRAGLRAGQPFDNSPSVVFHGAPYRPVGHSRRLGPAGERREQNE